MKRKKPLQSPDGTRITRQPGAAPVHGGGGVNCAGTDGTAAQRPPHRARPTSVSISTRTCVMIARMHVCTATAALSLLQWSRSECTATSNSCCAGARGVTSEQGRPPRSKTQRASVYMHVFKSFQSRSVASRSNLLRSYYCVNGHENVTVVSTTNCLVPSS